MKKWIGILLVVLMALSLLAACGSQTPSVSSTPGSNAPSGGNASPSGTKPSEPTPQGNTGSVTSGRIEYDPEELLMSYCDYVTEQGKNFEAVFNNMDELVMHMDLGLAVLDRDHLAFIPMYEEYNGSGQTIMGTPVTKKSSGDETTWEIEKVTENDLGNLMQKGDIEKTFISLNTKTNILYTEQTRMRGGEMITKEVNRVVALADGTILSEYYSLAPNTMGDGFFTGASIYKYNAEAQNFEMVHGEFDAAGVDFTPPECLTSDSFDKDAFLAFATETGTVKVTAGVGELILP